jgi:hypothetical protein
MPRLEEWSIVSIPSNPFQAPELWSKRLSGKVYDDDRFEEGSIVTTSRLVELNLKSGYALTKNTRYELGSPSDEYIEWLTSQGKTIEDYI